MPLHRVSGSEYAALRPQEELRLPAGSSSPVSARPAAGNPPAKLPLPPGLRPGGGDVPAGADPQVWLALSVEERAYFARVEESGPLSYGPSKDGDVLYRGRHLHIKA
jgi:hypothetical protein